MIKSSKMSNRVISILVVVTLMLTTGFVVATVPVNAASIKILLIRKMKLKL